MNETDLEKWMENYYWLKEWLKGFESGRLHDDDDPLCQENIKKMKTGKRSKYPLIRAYWSGYNNGVNI